MSVHPNKVMCGALLLVVLVGFFLFPPTPLQVPAYADVPLKEMESLGSRIRYRTVSWQHSRSTGKTTYNINVINLSHDPIYPPIRIAVDSISVVGVTLDVSDGTMDGHPYIEIGESDIPDGVLDPGEELSSLNLVFDNQSGVKFTYTVAYYGCMELKETTFAALGTTPRMLLNENLSIRIISVRLNRTRGGVEYRVALRNIGDENVYGPVRLGVDDITNASVELADYYAQMGDLPYIIIEDEIPGGVLAPGEESDPIWLYFSDPPRAKFSFSTKPHAFKAYYYDATDQLNVLLEDLGIQTGVNQFSVNVTNQALTALQGPVRMKITGMTVAGVPFTGDMASVVQSKSGVVGGMPYQMIIPEQNQISAGQSTSVTLAVANTTGDELSFTLEFESLYESMPVLANAAVSLGAPVNDATAGTTTYNATITNNGSHAIVSPMMLVLDSVDGGVELQNLSGYINGKPFVEVNIPTSKLFSQESQSAQLIFTNPGQIAITPVVAVQGTETDVIADTEAPESSYIYAYNDQWVNLNEVAVQLTATDNISGVKAIYYSLNGAIEQQYSGLLTFSMSDVPRIITFWAEDNAGNQESPANQVVVKLDKDAPHSRSTFTANGKWLRQNAVVAVNADDLYLGNKLSGVLNIKYKVGDGGSVETVAGTSVTIPVSNEGQYPVYFWAEDNAGNVEQQKTVMVWIDKTPPTTNFSYPEDGQWVGQPVSISLIGSDSGSGNVVVHYTIDGIEHTGNTVQISEPGTHEVTCWSVDAAGNVETMVHHITVKIDTEAPSVNHSFTQIGEWLGADSMVTITAEDLYQGTELTGVQSISYKVGDVGSVETVAGASVDVPLNLEGQTPVYFWATDAMGNESAQSSFEVWIDKTAPTTTYSYPSDGQWTSQPANIALVANDSASGVAHTYYTINGAQHTGNLIQIAQAGEYDVTCWSVDNAGNIETPAHQISIKIDDQVLGVTHDYQHSGQWITEDTVVTLTASSGNIGVKNIQYKIGENGTVETVLGDVAQVSITDEGQYTVYFWAHDNEDTASVENSFTVWLDKTNPTISYTYADAGQWVNQPVTIPLEGNDDLGSPQSSGVSKIYYTINGTQYTGSSIQITKSGEYDITCWSVDGAGNTCAPGLAFEVKLDTQAPNVTHDFTRVGQWVTGDTVITIEADDLQFSGVQAIYYQIGDNGSLESVSATNVEIALEDAGTYSVYFWATDIAGNESAHQSVNVMVDSVDPATTATYDHDGIWITGNVSIPLVATDADSGVAQIRYSINGTEYTGNLIEITQSGTYYVNFWSVDNAGNIEPRYTNQFTVMIDRAAPTTTTNVSNINNKWVNYPVDITLTQVDPEGNEGETYYRINSGSIEIGSQISLPDDGVFNIEYWSVDSLNNTEVTKTLTMKIDTKIPETTDNYDGTIIGEVTITLTPSDANGAIQVSGLKTTKYSINGGSSVLGTTIFLPGTGTYNIDYWSEDNAGNIEEKNTLSIAFITAPTLFITSPENGYTTTDATVDISGIIDNDSPTTIKCSDVVATITGTEFEIIGVPLQEGELYYSIEAENVAGLKDTRYVLVNKDTTAPAVTITDPVDGDFTALSTITITGSVEETDAIFYMENFAGQDRQLTIASDGTFTIENYALVEGENLLSFYGVDQLGNNGKTKGTQTQLTVTSDLTAPAMTLQVALYDPQTDQPGTPRPVNGTDVTFYHSVGKLDIIGEVDDLTATVRINGVDVDIASDGSFGKTGLTMTLNEGSEGVVTISARDDVQNLYRVYVRIIKDSIGPEIFVTSFEDGDITNDPAPKTVSGVARGTDEVIVDGHAVAVVDERFTYSGWALDQGTNTLNISGADPVGNVTSISLDLILDSIPGGVPVISSPTVQPLYTNKDRVTIHGTADLSAVAVFSGGALDVEENVAANGSFTKNVFLNTNTTNNIAIQQRDVAGNLSDPATLVVIHDNRRPSLQVTSPSYSITDSYQVLVSANVSDDVELTENVAVELENNGAIINTLSAPIANGVASTMLNLGDGNYGQYKIIVTVTDRAGNTRVANLSMKYIEPSDDEEGPELVVTTPQNDAYVKDSNLVIQGSCLDRSGVGVFMISIDGGAYTDIPSADYDNDGTGAFNHTISLGSDGAHTIILIASDMTLAQNQSMLTLHVTLDTQPPLTAPTVSGITPGVEVDNDTFLTNNGTIRIIGSYEPGFKVTAQSSVQTKSVTVASTGIYEVEINIASSSQQNIENEINIVGYDQAGNASTATNPDLKKVINVTYDGIKPLVTDIMPIDGTTNVGLHDTITVTFSEAVQSGTLSGNQGNKIYVTDSQTVRYEGSLSIAANTDGKVVIYSLPDELDFADSEQLTITIENTIKDLAGNNLQTSYSTVFNTVDETPPAVPVVTSIVPGVVINEPSFHVVVTTDPDTDIIVYHAADDTPAATPVHSVGSEIDLELFVTYNTVNQFVLRATDLAGNESAASSVIEVLHDDIRPSIVSISPDETITTPIPYNTVFEVDFNEEISEDTIDSITLVNGSGPIDATFNLMPNSGGVQNALVRIVPTDLLSDGAIVTLSVNEDIQDIAGNALDLSAELNNVKKVVYTVEDNVAPDVPTIDSISEESPTTSLEVTITGTTEPGATIVVNGGGLSETLLVDSDNDTGVFEAIIPLQGNKNNVIALKARDWADNTSEGITITLYSDQKAPTLSSIMPAEGAVLPSSGLFTLVFNEEIDQSTFDAISIMKGSTALPATVTVNEDGNILTVHSDNELDMTMPHTLVIGTGIADIAGNHFAEERIVSYDTDDPIFPVAPMLTSATETTPTTASEITFEGIGENFTEVTVVQAVIPGGTVVAEVSTYDTRFFTITVPLQANKANVIRIRGKRPSGNIGEPTEVVIVRDIAAPEIAVLAPTSGVTLPSDSVTLVALITDATEVTSCKVNGEEKILNLDDNGYLTTILEGLTDGMNITIEATDEVNNKATESFPISVSIEDPNTEMNPPIISIIFPEDGMHFDGQSIDLKGTVEDANDISMITVNGERVTTPQAFPTQSAYYLTTTELHDGTNVITVNAWDMNNNMGTATVTMDVDIAPPSLIITSPEYEGIFMDSNVTISGRVTDSNGISELIMGEVGVAYDNDGYFSVDLHLEEGANTVSFKATDVAGNITSVDWIVYYDVEGPILQAIDPVDGETEVPFSSSVRLEFDERVDPATVSTNTVKVIYLDDIGDAVKELTGNVAVDRNVVVFSPNTLFEPGITYRVKVLNGIRDLVGFPLQNPTSTVFTVDTEITTVYGMVIDPDTGNGVYNATVSIVGTDISQKTDKLGHFTIRRATIPAGLQVLAIDGTTAIVDDNIQFGQNRCSILILTNETNTLNKSIYVPRINPLSTEYINGKTEQVVTFNDTITGSIEDNIVPDRFSMTVPAGALEFPNGSTSGALSATTMHEMFLPNPSVNPAFTSPVVTAVWFQPFGVKCNEPVSVNIPFPSDRGDTGISPGDRFMIVSYNSETCEWDEIGIGTASDDAKVLEMADEYGLDELTIVAIFPIAYNVAMENELNVMYKKYYGGSGEDQFLGLLLEMMVAISIMSMMNSVSIQGWQVFRTHPTGTAMEPYPGVMGKISNEFKARQAWEKGEIYSSQSFFLFPNLIWLMLCLSLEYVVNCTVDVEWVSGRTGMTGIRNLPICSYTLVHSVFSGINFRNPFPMPIDVWGYTGDIRFVGSDGQPTANPDPAPQGTPWVGVYSDAQQYNGGASGLVDGDPVASCNFLFPPTESSAGQWWKSYQGATIKSNMWAVGRKRPIYDDKGAEVNSTWRSYIYPDHDIRILCKVGDYAGDNYTKAPIPQVSETTGNVSNINMYCNVTVGKLTVTCYMARQYTNTSRTGTLIAEQILPYKGIASICDSKLILYTGTVLANGKTSPSGDYVLDGKVKTPGGVAGIDVTPAGGSPWMSPSQPQAGKYEVTVSSNGQWGDNDLMYINLESKQATTTTPPAVTRPQSGRGGGRGVYVRPSGTQTGDSRRVTPEPAQDTDRKEYSVVVVGPIMYSSCGSGNCEAKVTYVDFTSFHQTADPNLINSLPVREEQLFTGNEPRVSIDHYTKLATKVEIQLNNQSLITGGTAEPGIAFKITQVGTPYALTKTIPADYFTSRRPSTPANAYAVHSPAESTVTFPVNVDKPSYFFIDLKVTGAKITLDIIPPPPPYDPDTGSLDAVLAYFDFLETERESSFSNRYWQLEIIDRNTMLTTETGGLDMTDSVYNLIEKVTIRLD